MQLDTIIIHLFNMRYKFSVINIRLISPPHLYPIEMHIKLNIAASRKSSFPKRLLVTSYLGLVQFCDLRFGTSKDTLVNYSEYSF